MSAPAGYRTGAALAEHVSAIPALERAAASLFDGHGIPPAVLAQTSEIAALERARQEGRLFTAVDDSGRLVGYAFAGRLAGAAHLEEIDVHPDHGRRGIGRALVECVERWGRAQKLRALTLTTYRDIPWNRPYYEKLGFRVLSQHEIEPALAARVEHEAGEGLDPALRVCMQRLLASE